MMTRKERMLSTLIKGEESDLEPITRTEKYLECAIKKSGTADAPEPVTRMDYLLKELADKISQGGSGAETQTKTVDLSLADGDQTVTPDSGKVLSSVTVTKPDTLIPGNIKKDVNIGGVVETLESGSGGLQPQLHAPTISVSEDTLTITPDTSNGDFVTGWKGYCAVGGEEEFSLFGTLPVAVTSLDLTTQSLPAAVYRFKATASGTNFQDSADSNVVSYSNIFYSVTNTLSNCTSSNSATSVRHGSAYSATLTASSGYIMSGATVTVMMGGTDITSTAYSNGVITIAQVTGAIVVTASAEANTTAYFATSSWEAIRDAIINKGVAAAFGDQVGDTRSITLKNGTTAVLRLVNATDDLYERSDGSGSTGFVVEFTNLYFGADKMRDTNINTGGWYHTNIRQTVMPTIVEQLPDDLAAVLATVKIKSSPTTSNGLVTSEDQLFLAAEKELFTEHAGGGVAGDDSEWNALTTWQWYAANTDKTNKIRKAGSNAEEWWLRTQKAYSSTHFGTVSGTGSLNWQTASQSRYICPCFCI